MENAVHRKNSALPRMAYSYLAVGVAVLVGLVMPHATTLVLGPVLLLGLVGLGLAHGACDQLVVPIYRPGNAPGAGWKYLMLFVAAYLAVAAVVVLGWWQWPAVTVSCFFLLTVWHWGSADAPPGLPALWVGHSVLRGALLFALPAVAWPSETLGIINGLLLFAGATPLAEPYFQALTSGLWQLVLAGHIGLWLCYAYRRESSRWQTDACEVGMLAALFVVLPPLLALGVYFSFWHSLQHVLRLSRRLSDTPQPKEQFISWRTLGQEILSFGRRSLPLLVVSLLALGALYFVLAARLPNGDTIVSLALIVASVVTLPHAVLVSVVMDAKKWQRRIGVVAAKSKAPQIV